MVTNGVIIPYKLAGMHGCTCRECQLQEAVAYPKDGLFIPILYLYLNLRMNKDISFGMNQM